MRLCTDDNALYTLIPMTNNPLCHCEPFFNCHCEPKAWQSQESKTQKSKGKMTEQK